MDLLMIIQVRVFDTTLQAHISLLMYISVISSVLDEISYWQNVADTSRDKAERNQSLEFLNILKNLEKDFG